MMQSSYDTLESILREVLTSRTPEFIRVTDGSQSFLVLLTDYDIAGFVVLDGQAKAAYDSAYARFKQLNRDHHTDWHGKTLSFVLCPMESSDAEDAFLNELETDVYFCKKYIVQYSDAPQEFRSAVVRLPFVPLPEGERGGIIRPLSAQTLLQQMGVYASLAEQLVVPRAYSADHIVNDILDGKRDLTRLTEAPRSFADAQPHVPTATRAMSLSIEGFRSYKDRREFDLDADLVVLFGPNGTGKTSFFDALDFVCTGRIGRLCSGRINRSRFVNFTKHLDIREDLSRVTLKTTNESQETEFVRYVKDWTFAWVKNKRLDRASVLQELTSAKWPEKKARIENLEKLFRATHLFSQTDPELFSTFATTSVITADLVSRMLAMDDYASGLKKTDDVLAVIRKKIADLSRESANLAIHIKDLRAKQQTLGKPTVESAPSETAERIASEIQRDACEIPGMELADGPLNLQLMRNWRALLQAATDHTQTEIEEVMHLQEELPNLHSAEKQEQECSESLTRIAEEATKNREQCALLTKSKEKAQAEIETLQVTANEAKQIRAQITEAKALRTQLPILGTEAKQLMEKIRFYETRLAELIKQRSELESRLETIDENNKNTAATLSAQIAKRQALEELGLKAQHWQADVRKHMELTASLRPFRVREEALKKQRKDTEEHLKKAKTELGSAEDAYRKLARDTSELTKLLDQIENFVTTNICPLCGADHKTKELLINKVQTQKQGRPAPVDSAARVVRRLKTVYSDLRDSADKLENEESQLGESIQEISEALSITSERIKSFLDAAKDLNFDPSSGSLLQEIQGTATKAASEADQTSAVHSAQKKKRKVIETERSRLIEELDKLTSELTEARNRADTITHRKRDLERKIRKAGIETDLANDQVNALVQDQENRLKAAEERTADLMKSLSKQEKEINHVENAHKRLFSEQQALKLRRKSAAKLVKSFVKQMDSAGFPVNATAERISKRASELAVRQKRLDTASAKVRFLEQMLDAAAKSAAMAEIESQMKEAEAKHSKNRQEASELGASREWFDRVRGSLRSQREHAVESHIEAYGPLSTIIQKRLRAVYGFGDIKLESKKDEIHVTVSWGSKVVHPTDYFSESQKQILMLSLFLAGRLTQTWSGFAPILMDDPVTHFDDLNAYSFVELLRGLLEKGPSDRQFFVSTCEDRLFSLMREKLGNLSGGAKFYRFQSMSPAGPEVVPV